VGGGKHHGVSGLEIERASFGVGVALCVVGSSGDGSRHGGIDVAAGSNEVLDALDVGCV
jgi:hypothetical protein